MRTVFVLPLKKFHEIANLFPVDHDALSRATTLQPNLAVRQEPLALVKMSTRNVFGIRSEKLDHSVIMAVVPSSRTTSQTSQLHWWKDRTEGFIMSTEAWEAYNGRAATEPESYIYGRATKPECIDWSVIRGWLKYCDECHVGTCQSLYPHSGVGIYLIDAFSLELIRTSDKTVRYIALSYLWGPDPEKAVGPDFPPVITDALAVTRQLSYRYLWVDRICIPQDDGKEKLEQIQNMGNIYSNASLTIIAAAGEDPEYGLPGVSVRQRRSQPKITIGELTLVSTMPNIKHEILKTKWNTRGWTYQEALLSSRRLVFTDSQVYFQCSLMYCVESVVQPLDKMARGGGKIHSSSFLFPRVFPSHGIGKSSMDIVYRIQEYQKRQLSRPTDGMDAFEGILRRFQIPNLNTDNLLGVPIFPSLQHNPFKGSVHTVTGNSVEVHEAGVAVQLAFSLRWRLQGYPQRRPAFPSWTWLGWENGTFIIPHGSIISANEGEHRQFLVLVDIAVEFAPGQVLAWPLSRRTILSLNNEGNHARYLHVNGFLMPIECAKSSSDGKWIFEFRWWQKYSELLARYYTTWKDREPIEKSIALHLERLALPPGEQPELYGLVLFAWYPPRHRYDESGRTIHHGAPTIEILIVRVVRENGNKIFQRLPDIYELENIYFKYRETCLEVGQIKFARQVIVLE